jgi:hypothetical protein
MNEISETEGAERDRRRERKTQHERMKPTLCLRREKSHTNERPPSLVEKRKTPRTETQNDLVQLSLSI